VRGTSRLAGRASAGRARCRRGDAGFGPGPWTLTTAELRLLPHLPTHLTFREIAERLFLSPHTVKTQAIAVYGKLGVSSRRGAIEQAVRAGLLDPSVIRFPSGPSEAA
jgi:LuxR family maltose regulon positive regulatory protein